MAFNVNLRPYNVEFLMPGSNKATGLKHVCEALGVSLAEVVSFGDANNDVEMLQASGVSYAMVGRCSLTTSKPVLKAPLVSALEPTT